MPYSINQLAKIAKVSVRTLHHYDAIGLLSSVRNPKNKYREYGESDLLRLQQILFFRELDFKLDDIKSILKSPTFSITNALNEHRQMIILKRKRLDALIKTIDKTISKVTKNTNMKDEELYDSFTEEEMKKYAAEAKERWGNTAAYKESTEKYRSMSKEQLAQIKTQGETITNKIAALVGTDVHSDRVQKHIAEHYKHLSNFYTPNMEMYRELAEMYIADPRFTAYYEKYAVGLAQFMHDAMIVFVESH